MFIDRRLLLALGEGLGVYGCLQIFLFRRDFGYPLRRGQVCRLERNWFSEFGLLQMRWPRMERE